MKTKPQPTHFFPNLLNPTSSHSHQIGALRRPSHKPRWKSSELLQRRFLHRLQPRLLPRLHHHLSRPTAASLLHFFRLPCLPCLHFCRLPPPPQHQLPPTEPFLRRPHLSTYAGLAFRHLFFRNLSSLRRITPKHIISASNNLPPIIYRFSNLNFGRETKLFFDFLTPKFSI